MIKISRSRKRYLIWILSVFITALSFFFSPGLALTQTGIDANLPTRIWNIPGSDNKGNKTDNEVLLPDWSTITLSSMPPIAQSGSFDGKSYTSDTGYDLSRTWITGQTPDQYLKMGDIANELQPQLFSIGTISQLTGLNLDNVALSSFVLVGEQTLEQLVQAVPNLGQRTVREVPPVQSLSVTKGVSASGGSTIEQLVKQYPQIAQSQMKETDLSTFPISSVPNLDAAQLQKFNQWRSSFIKDIPGLNQVPLASMPKPISEIGDLVMRIDTIYGTAENKRTNAISGSDVEGFSVPCTKGKCGYIELDDLENSGRGERGSLEGKQWVSGKFQEVEGGWGCLKGVNRGKEPTGRLPFGGAFKVAVWDTDETTDSTNTALFFRFCSICGCTPYFIGPVPFFSYRVNAPLFVGTLNDERAAASSTPTTAQTSGVPKKSGSMLKPPANATNPTSALSHSASEKNSDAGYRTVNGVKLDALKSAIASIESSNSYEEIGPYVVADRGKNRGRALGKYQDMSYNPEAVRLIASKPGGREWLERIQTDPSYKPSREELFKYFPPTEQEAAIDASLQEKIALASQQIDPATGQPFTGERLVQRVAQMHFGGNWSAIDGGKTDSFGRLSIYSYGRDALLRYKSSLQAGYSYKSAVESSNSVADSRAVVGNNGFSYACFSTKTGDVTFS